MTLDDILAALPATLTPRDDGLFSGSTRIDGRDVDVIGVSNRQFVGVDQALWLSARVLETIRAGRKKPILVVIDSGSQRMSKRDELLGLNEYLAHLAKCLTLASQAGHGTVGLLYGHTAAGAFIATALATRVLLALPGAEPTVMDLPSMSRVTKLPVDVLEAKAKSTPVFAPGLDNLAKMGAIDAILDADEPLAAQIAPWLDASGDLDDRCEQRDQRDRRGEARGGRPAPARIAENVYERARSSI